MKKVDSTIVKETTYVALVTLVLSVLMQSVFLVLGKWNLSVLFSNILGAFFSVLNFFLMGLTIQSSLGKEVKDAKNRMKLSQTLRTLMMFLVAVVAYVVSYFNIIAVVIPYLFPRIAVTLRGLTIKKGNEVKDE